jgi:hypothetical protein
METMSIKEEAQKLYDDFAEYAYYDRSETEQEQIIRHDYNIKGCISIFLKHTDEDYEAAIWKEISNINNYNK